MLSRFWKRLGIAVIGFEIVYILSLDLTYGRRQVVDLYDRRRVEMAHSYYKLAKYILGKGFGELLTGFGGSYILSGPVQEELADRGAFGGCLPCLDEERCSRNVLSDASALCHSFEDLIAKAIDTQLVPKLPGINENLIARE